MLYMGDEPVGVGTPVELAEMIGVKVDTIRHYASPTYLRSVEGRDGVVRVVRVDDGEEQSDEGAKAGL